MFISMCFSLFMVVYRSLNTTRESITADARDAVGEGDGCQAAAATESQAAD